MSFIATITLIETLAVFNSQPVSIVSDKAFGFYVATQGEVFHYANDSLIESISRYDKDVIQGITSAVFTGNRVYAVMPYQKRILMFDRRLRYLGRIDTDRYSPDIIAARDGNLVLFDPFKKEIVVLSNMGDPVEIQNVPINYGNPDNLVMLGYAVGMTFYHVLNETID